MDSSETYTEPTAEGSVGPDGLAVPPAGAPEEVVAIIEAGNRIARKPYKYGGGHGKLAGHGLRLLRLGQLRPPRGRAARLAARLVAPSRAGASAAAATGSRSGPTRATRT